jgi:4,5-DOPA dioxygenase extradiol
VSTPSDHPTGTGPMPVVLRRRGVLVVGSGNVVHNLRRIDRSQPDAGFDWARRFGDAAAEVMTTAPAGAAGLEAHEHYETAAPTPDHFIPLLYLAGLPSAAGDTARVLIDGYAMGSLSMACYTIGCDDLVAGGDGGAPPLPRVPADETNI